MVNYRTLDQASRGSIQTLKEEGYSVRDIGKRLNIPFSTVQYSLKCFKQRKSHKNFKSSGRPRATTSSMDKFMTNMIEISDKPNAIDVANKLAEMNLADISVQTVRRRLNESDLHGRATQKKPLLTNKHVKQRLEFGLKHQSWTVDDWKRVLWSDETKINKMGSDGRSWTWKKTGEALKPKHVKQTVKHDAYIMAWGCFNSTGVGNIHVVEGIMNARMYIRIISTHMIPSASRLFESEYIFQQDNDPKHTARVVKEYFERKKIKVLDWPSQSPDLNPIENLWHQLKILIAKEKIEKVSELPAAMRKCWEMITPDYCNKLVESMPRRMDELVRNKGYWTKY